MARGKRATAAGPVAAAGRLQAKGRATSEEDQGLLMVSTMPSHSGYTFT